jgi:hypothetical protein
MEKLDQIDDHRKRVAFMRACAASPGEFLCDLIASQARDLKVPPASLSLSVGSWISKLTIRPGCAW